MTGGQGMTETDADVELVLAAYSAFARGDIAAATSHLAPDVVWIEPEGVPNGGRHVGPEAVAAYLRASREMWAELESRPEAHREGRRISVRHHVSGPMMDGTRHENTVADVFTIQDGRVVEMVAY